MIEVRNLAVHGLGVHEPSLQGSIGNISYVPRRCVDRSTLNRSSKGIVASAFLM